MGVEAAPQVGQVQGHVPAAPGPMPQFIQFRHNGVNIGGPDATVVDFVGVGFTVTRGTGAAQNTVSVSFA